MIRSCLAIVLLIATTVAVHAEEAAQIQAVKKAAQEIAIATVEGDFSTVIDLTVDGIVELAGGREKAIQELKTTMAKLGEIGVKIASYEVQEPQELVAEGDLIFVVVPYKIGMSTPQGKFLYKTYVIGISSDEGKTWKFADGSKLNQNDATTEKVLPKLPAKLKVPEKEAPKRIKD